MHRYVLARAPWVLCALFAWLGAESIARAYEDRAELGVGLGYGHAVARSAWPAHGAVIDLDASLGLDDVWTARARLSYGYHPASVPLSVFMAGADLLYLIDIFELVPYFGAGLDGIALLQAGGLESELGVHPVIGIDWLVSREFTIGFEARPVFLLTALNRDPIYLTLSVSTSWLIEL